MCDRPRAWEAPLMANPRKKFEFVNEVERKEFTVVSDWGKIPSAIKKHIYSIPNVPKRDLRKRELSMTRHL